MGKKKPSWLAREEEKEILECKEECGIAFRQETLKLLSSSPHRASSCALSQSLGKGTCQMGTEELPPLQLE